MPITDEERAAAEALLAERAAAEAKKAEDDAKAERDRKVNDIADEIEKKSKAELVEYAKLLREGENKFRTRAKAAEAELNAIKSERDEANRQKLLADKKFEELAAAETKKREAAEVREQKALAEIAKVQTRSQVRDAARAAGLKNLNILKAYDLVDLKANDDGSVDEREISKFIRSLKSEYPELFIDAKALEAEQEEGRRKAALSEAERQREEDRKRDDAVEKAERERDDERRRRARTTNGGDSIDWSTLTKEQFAAEEAKLLKGIGRTASRV